MGPLGDKQLLRELESAKGFGLGVPVDRVEDPVVPSVLLHDAFLQGWTASGSLKASSEVPSDSDSIDCDGSFRRRHGGTSLEVSDQLSDQLVARMSAW